MCLYNCMDLKCIELSLEVQITPQNFTDDVMLLQIPYYILIGLQVSLLSQQASLRDLHQTCPSSLTAYTLWGGKYNAKFSFVSCFWSLKSFCNTYSHCRRLQPTYQSNCRLSPVGSQYLLSETVSHFSGGRMIHSEHSSKLLHCSVLVFITRIHIPNDTAGFAAHSRDRSWSWVWFAGLLTATGIVSNGQFRGITYQWISLLSWDGLRVLKI